MYPWAHQISNINEKLWTCAPKSSHMTISNLVNRKFAKLDWYFQYTYCPMVLCSSAQAYAVYDMMIMAITLTKSCDSSTVKTWDSKIHIFHFLFNRTCWFNITCRMFIYHLIIKSQSPWKKFWLYHIVIESIDIGQMVKIIWHFRVI